MDTPFLIIYRTFRLDARKKSAGPEQTGFNRSQPKTDALPSLPVRRHLIPVSTFPPSWDASWQSRGSHNRKDRQRTCKDNMPTHATLPGTGGGQRRVCCIQHKVRTRVDQPTWNPETQTHLRRVPGNPTHRGLRFQTVSESLRGFSSATVCRWHLATMRVCGQLQRVQRVFQTLAQIQENRKRTVEGAKGKHNARNCLDPLRYPVRPSNHAGLRDRGFALATR